MITDLGFHLLAYAWIQEHVRLWIKCSVVERLFRCLGPADFWVDLLRLFELQSCGFFF